MAHFAKLDNNNTVLEVIVVHNNEAPDEASGIAFLTSLLGPARWVQTSYNGNIRKNYAGIGYTYDPVRDAFIPPQPFASWVLDETTCQWEAPMPMPQDGVYVWDEATLAWVAV